ncbi:MAG TPA: hypothetical protein VGB71_03980 [Flavisolibacter sp.]|jgi:hypothetical protein
MSLSVLLLHKQSNQPYFFVSTKTKVSHVNGLLFPQQVFIYETTRHTQ